MAEREGLEKCEQGGTIRDGHGIPGGLLKIFLFGR